MITVTIPQMIFMALFGLGLGGVQIWKYVDDGQSGRIPLAAITFVVAAVLAILALGAIGRTA